MYVIMTSYKAVLREFEDWLKDMKRYGYEDWSPEFVLDKINEIKMRWGVD